MGPNPVGSSRVEPASLGDGEQVEGEFGAGNGWLLQGLHSQEKQQWHLEKEAHSGRRRQSSGGGCVSNTRLPLELPAGPGLWFSFPGLPRFCPTPAETPAYSQL